MNTPDAIHDHALLTVSQWQRKAITSVHGHRAAEVAAALWDERDEHGRLRDLLPHEQAFLTEVHQIDRDFVKVCGDAKRSLSPSGALAVEFTARARRDERYQAALDRYDAVDILH